IIKYPGKKRGGSGGSVRQRRARGADAGLGHRAGDGGGVGDDLGQLTQVLGEALAALAGEAAKGAGAAALELLGDGDQPGLLQDGEVAAEVAVGEAAQGLEVVEGEALGMGGER